MSGRIQEKIDDHILQLARQCMEVLINKADHFANCVIKKRIVLTSICPNLHYIDGKRHIMIYKNKIKKITNNRISIRKE